MTDPKSYFEYRLRLQVPANSSDRHLLEYIKTEQHLTYTEKEMVLAALRMCWLPLAYEQLDLSDRREDLQRVALDAILRLREQIQYLSAIAGITSLPPPEPAPTLRTPPILSIEPVQAPRPASAHPASAHRRTIAAVRSQSADGYEEDLFGDD